MAGLVDRLRGYKMTPRHMEELCAEAATEIESLQKIEAAAVACDRIEMRDCYEVPKQAWEDLMKVVWEAQASNAEVSGTGTASAGLPG